MPAVSEPDPLAAALALPVASELVGARDTERFAWVEKVAGVRNLWIADRGRPALRITDYREDDGLELSNLELSADGARLAFVRGGDSEFPDERLPNAGAAASTPPQQLFVVAPGSAPILVGEGHSPAFAPDGDRLAFTRRGEIWLWSRGGEARKLATTPGEVRRLQWSPDGAHLLFIDHRGDYSFVALLDVAGRRLAYLDPGLGFAVEPIFSPDGRRVAFVHYVEPPAGAAADAGPYWSIRIADSATGLARRLWTAPAGPGGQFEGTRGRDLFWSADGRLIFPWERSGWLHAYAIDAERGGTPIDLTPGDFEVETYLLGPGGRSLLYAANSGDLNRRHVWRRPLAGGGAARVTTGSVIESLPALAGSALAVIATDVTHPAYPALADRDLVPLKPAAAAPHFEPPEPVRFRAADGVEVHAMLFRGKGRGRRPALVFVHGGPRRQMIPAFHPSGYYSNAYVFNQHLAARGYTVLAVNYRSGTGYGAAFRDAPEQARGGASEYRDVLAAGRWLAARGDVDPARIGIWGGSWGGYLTALALARDSDLFAAGVDFHGVHSMLRPLPGNLSPDAQAAARQLQWDSSPMGAIERWRSPILLIHGDDDRNVDFSQSVLLARELAARRIPYRELVFPNERHSFLLHAHWLASFRAAEAFLDETLKEPRR
ncbi:MAG TPA: prolyl oligopeptidase family serine peptidase [Allosphingosinicella sp.]|nr:prolyl oligopeptidase family serine peptidase [Allosphingosinicella sp.]